MFDVSFTLHELLRATEGRLVGGDAPAMVDSVFTDTRESAKNALFLAFSGEQFDAHDYLAQAVANGASLLCVEENKIGKIPPGVPAIAVPSTMTAFQRIARFHRLRFPNLKVILLSGSCGKTSTKESLRAIFVHAMDSISVLATEGNTNNQIGLPQNLLRLNARHRIAILEAGTNHHGELEPLSYCAMPDLAIIVSIANCHLEFLGSLEGVAQEKSKLFSHLAPGGLAIIPAKCPGQDILARAAVPFRTGTFGFEDTDADVTAKYLGGNLHGAKFILTRAATGEAVSVQWGIPGRHQAGNAAAAALAALSFGIPFQTIAEGLGRTTLPGLRMRVSEHGGATWINDAYNANPDSMAASLNWLSEFADPKKLVLVLGDMGELGTMSEEGHRSVCALAKHLFPGARCIVVGPHMTAAAEETGLDCIAYPSAQDAAKASVPAAPGSLVFLKASRSTHLELLEPAGA
ncbi:MAG: UDP-N-acetylmuramoyl-tripeptide--D-alanyl-D-alanine ligase [Lentisphaeria bacterium]|nr:UDP-N-acetylmuramoyl-tripeptide--D-alanyl-D-alanine ligase [Lentisphaeria bacterium]